MRIFETVIAGDIMKAYRNILIIKMSSLGDILHALPTLAALRRNLPEARISWAVHDAFADMLPGTPWIDEIIRIDRKRLKSPSYLVRLRRDLHARRFDMCLDLQCIAKSAVVSALSGASEKYGYWELREGSGLVNKPLVGAHKFGHVIERYLDTVRALDGTVGGIEFPLPVYEEAAVKVEALLRDAFGSERADEGIDMTDESDMNGKEKDAYVVIAPGARRAIKEWPPERFGEVAKRLVAGGMRVVLVGAAAEVPLCEAVIHAAGRTEGLVSLAGRTNLHELTELVRGAKMFLSADTGPLHLANALRIPLVALYGPTSPERTGPYGGADATYIHIVVSPTSKATTDEPIVDDPDCMAAIDVDIVMQSIESAMKI